MGSNSQLIEALEYHKSILEKREVVLTDAGKEKLAQLGGVIGGSVGGAALGSKIGGYASDLKNRKAWNTLKAADKEAAEFMKKANTPLTRQLAYAKQHLHDLDKLRLGFKRVSASNVGRAMGLSGGAITGMVLAKKAYNHFKNKKGGNR